MSLIAHRPGSHFLADPVRLCRRCGHQLGDAGTTERKSTSTGLCGDCYRPKRAVEAFARCTDCGRWTPEDLPECIYCNPEKGRPS